MRAEIPFLREKRFLHKANLILDLQPISIIIPSDEKRKYLFEIRTKKSH